MPVKAITFDFWCTLFGDVEEHAALRRQIRIEAFVKRTGVSTELAAEAHRVAAEAFMQHHIEQQQTLAPMDAVNMMAKTCGVELDEEDKRELAECFATAILAHPPQPIEGALEAVQLAAQLRPVGLISDSGLSPGSSLSALLERNGFVDYFQALTFSDQVGVAKPQALMFERAAENLNVAPHEMLHLGDLEPTDIVGALGVGSQAGLFTGHHAKYLEGTRAQHTFGTWAEFIDTLREVLDRCA